MADQPEYEGYRICGGCGALVSGGANHACDKCGSLKFGSILDWWLKKERRIAGLEAQHEDMVNRNAMLRERPDLPVDRIPAYRKMAKKIAQLETALNAVEWGNEAFNHKLRKTVGRCVECGNIASFGHSPDCIVGQAIDGGK